MKHLINKKTGVVFVWTEALAKHKDMVLYDFEAEKPVAEIPMKLRLAADLEPDTDIEAEKERAAELVKEWFGRDVSKVTKEDLAEYAMDTHGKVLEDDSKLKMVLALEAMSAE